MKYRCSAPGSVMLFGEHAVLHGAQALCGAVYQRLHVTLTPRSDKQVQLNSALGNCRFTLDTMIIAPPFQFVLTAIQQYLPELPSGFELSLTSDFAPTLGLGSSAAATVATLAVIGQWLNKSLTAEQLYQLARDVIVTVQGMGSGADVAAAAFGGIVAYRLQPSLHIHSFPFTPEMVLVYSGAKVPTPAVIRHVAERQKAQPQKYQTLFQAIHDCATAAVAALSVPNWQQWGSLMTEHQRLQEELGVSTPLLNSLVSDLCQQPGVLGAKISGSGMGDCVLGLGSIADHVFPRDEAQQRLGVRQIPIRLSTQGVCYE